MERRLSMATAGPWYRLRPYYAPGDDKFFRRNYWVLLLSLVLFVAALLYRSWPNFLQPGLYVEDNSHYFNYFYGNVRGWADILKTPNDYHTILPNLIGLLVAHFDVRIQPAIYLWTATTMAVLACMVLPATGLLKNRYVIFAAPFVLGLSGLNHLFYYVTLTYQIYVFVILLLALLFWRPLDSAITNLVLFVVMSLLIWSGPYSVLLVPFSLCFIVFFRGKTGLLLCLCVVTICYTLSVEANTILVRNAFKAEIYQIWWSTLVSKVFFMGLKGGYGPIKAVLAIAFFLAIGIIFRKDHFYLKIVFLLLVIINGSLAALLYSKKIMLALRILPCYLVIAQFFWVFLVIFTADRLVSLKKNWYHAGIFVCILAALFIKYDHRKMPEKGTLPVMSSLPEFLDTVHQLEKQDLAAQNRLVIVELGDKPFRPIVRIGNQKDPQIKPETIHIK